MAQHDVLTKSAGQLAMRIEHFAWAALNEVLAISIAAAPFPTEYGGTIYLNPHSGALGQVGPVPGDPGTFIVDIKWERPNMGCPAGTRPVAWYHTHPAQQMMGMALDSKAFVGGDKYISDFEQIPGYVGVYDGTFWRYDPPSGPKPGEPVVVGDDGKLPVLGDGRFTLLNAKLRTTLKTNVQPTERATHPRSRH
jgi:hypothetical protein